MHTAVLVISRYHKPQNLFPCALISLIGTMTWQGSVGGHGLWCYRSPRTLSEWARWQRLVGWQGHSGAQQIQPQNTERCGWNHKEWSTVTHHLAVAILKHRIHIYLKIKCQEQVIKCIQKPSFIQEYFSWCVGVGSICNIYITLSQHLLLLCLLLRQLGVFLWILTH